MWRSPTSPTTTTCCALRRRSRQWSRTRARSPHADQYAKVREWGAVRMAVEGEYEAADGEYLIEIRDALQPVHGIWTAYQHVRGVPERTAYQRIQASEGRYMRSKPATVTPLPAPQPAAQSHPPPFTPAPSSDAAPADAHCTDEPTSDDLYAIVTFSSTHSVPASAIVSRGTADRAGIRRSSGILLYVAVPAAIVSRMCQSHAIR